MPTPFEYEATDLLPEGIPAMLLDNGARVLVKVNARMDCADLAPALNRLVAQYRDRHPWDRVSPTAGHAGVPAMAS